MDDASGGLDERDGAAGAYVEIDPLPSYSFQSEIGGILILRSWVYMIPPPLLKLIDFGGTDEAARGRHAGHR